MENHKIKHSPRESDFRFGSRLCIEDVLALQTHVQIVADMY